MFTNGHTTATLLKEAAGIIRLALRSWGHTLRLCLLLTMGALITAVVLLLR
ncbi:hypothetical protein [Kitasatospora azatica]|uniref:hypothetical protein n=1 Tax=Kitasatospora azatica TaxID=58347 RepID=UPI000AFC50D7|nr:hypothetical protein [Kitasatospora azatica]